MAFFKCTWFFESLQQGELGAGSDVGWTETWYASFDGTVEAIWDHPDLQTWIQLRQAFLDSIYRIAFLRISQEPEIVTLKGAAVWNSNAHNVKVEAVVAGQGAQGGGSFHGQVQCCLLADLMAPWSATDVPLAIHHRHLLLRGLPTSLVNGNIYNFTGVGSAAVDTFLNFVGDHETGQPENVSTRTTLFKLRIHDPAFWSNPITSMATNANDKRLVNIKFSPDASGVGTTILKNQPVTIRGVPDEEGYLFNGKQFRATDNVPVNTEVPFGKFKKPLKGTWGYTGPGTAYLIATAWKYPAVSQYAIIGLRSKRTGKVSRQLRGKSRAGR